MKNKAFTLAEVLITLGIIGIVAALTMPVLIQKHQKQVATSRIKKFVSSFSQAILLAENDFGPHADWKKGANHTSEASLDFLNTYIKPYIKHFSIEEGLSPENVPGALMKLPDGSTLYVDIGACYQVYFDYNGDKKPNKRGRDIFPFILCRTEDDCAIKPVFRSAYCQTKEIFERDYPRTRDQKIEFCKINQQNCTILLENDNWEFKDDYPIKL